MTAGSTTMVGRRAGGNGLRELELDEHGPRALGLHGCAAVFFECKRLLEHLGGVLAFLSEPEHVRKRAIRIRLDRR